MNYKSNSLFEDIVNKNCVFRKSETRKESIVKWMYKVLKTEPNKRYAKGKTLLIILAAENKLCDYSFVITNSKVNVNLQDNYGNTALHYICKFDEGMKHSVCSILGRECDQQIINNEGDIPLYIFLKSCDFSKMYEEEYLSYRTRIFQDFISKDMHILRMKQKDRTTILHHLCGKYYNKYIFKMVMDMNLMLVNERDEYDRIPLHTACINGNDKVIKCLIKIGTFVNVGDCFGMTPIMYGLTTLNKKSMKMLLNHHNFKVNVDDKDGNTLLHHACKYVYYEGWKIRSKRYYCLDRLLERQDIKLNLANRNGEVPITLLAQHNIPYVEKLCKLGVDINSKNKYQFPLMVAYIYESYGRDRLFWYKGLNVNMKDNEGNTILHFACKISNIDLLKLCIENGCDPNAQNLEGKTPMHVLCNQVDINCSMLSVLLAVTKETNPDSKGKFRVYSSNNIHLDKRDNDGCTALHYAGNCESPKALLMLMECADFWDLLIENNAMKKVLDTSEHFKWLQIVGKARDQLEIHGDIKLWLYNKLCRVYDIAYRFREKETNKKYTEIKIEKMCRTPVLDKLFELYEIHENIMKPLNFY